MTASPEFDLSGRVVLITGAAGQIGTEVADALAAYGAIVVVSDLQHPSELEARAEQLAAAHGVESMGLQLDVTSDESVDAALAALERRFGRLDVLVNNAAIDAKFDDRQGAVDPARFEGYPLAHWQRTVDVNLTGLLRVTQAALRLMLRNHSGNIVNVASSYGLVSPNQSLYDTGRAGGQLYKPVDYVTTKAAIPNLTRYLATLYASEGIRCNCIAPHGVEHGHDPAFRANFARLSPIGRMCDVRELRGPFVFLASAASSYMTGATLVVDGGWTAW